MRLLFAGAGAVGGFLAARTTDAGYDVTVLVHPPRARQLRQAGLQLAGPGGTTVTRPHVLTADELTDPFDVVVLAVKADVVDAAIEDIGPAVGPATVLIPFLNGMGHLGPLVDRFGPAVAGGVLRVATEAQSDSSIKVLNPLFDVEIGELDGRGSQRIEAVAAVFSAAGANVTVSREIVRDMWAKWAFIASVGAITGLMRAPIGEVVSTPDGGWFARQVVGEAAAVAAAAGYPLDAGRRQGLERVVTDADSKLTSSLSRDLLAGRLTEVEPVLGDLAARGRAADVPVPLITASAVALRIHNRRLQATSHGRMAAPSPELFTRLAPVLNVSDLAAERAFYESLGFPVIYEGDEYPDFIAFGTDTVHFGIQPATQENDPPGVLTWQITVSDIDEAAERCRAAGVEFELEHNDPAPGWSYRRLILRTPSGYRLALEGENE